MNGINVNRGVTSELPSSDFPSPGVIRAPRGANPVKTAPKISREMVPLSGQATPRVMNPKLNTTPYPISYAQSRSEPSTARPRAERKGRKRVKTARQRRRGS